MTEGYRPEAEKDGKSVDLSRNESEAVKELVGPIKKILEDLRPEIERGQYRLLLGIDTSGRVPTLMLAAAIKEIYQNRGFPLPAVRFMQGSGSYNDKSEPRHREREFFTKYFEGFKRDVLAGNRESADILLIEELIDSGQSLRLPLEVLRSLGLKADVVTIAASAPEPLEEIRSHGHKAIAAQRLSPRVGDKPELSGMHVGLGAYYGPPSAITLREFITDRHSVEGKTRWTDAEREAIRPLEEKLSNVQRKINAVREMVSLEASSIAKEFLEGHTAHE